MFETSLIESKKQKPTGSRWLSVPMSVFLHFVVGGSVLAASMWYIEDIPEPPIPVTFYSEAAPPPPPPPRSRAARRGRSGWQATHLS